MSTINSTTNILIAPLIPPLSTPIICGIYIDGEYTHTREVVLAHTCAHNCRTRVGVHTHVKCVLLEDVIQDKLGDTWWQLYIAVAAMFVYFAMFHMRTYVRIFLCTDALVPLHENGSGNKGTFHSGHLHILHYII